MRRINLASVAACLLIVGASTPAVRGVAADDPPKPADARFETLYRDAMKAPEKADWKALRRAFAETSWYKPYSIDVTERLKEIARSIGRGRAEASEAELLKLIEREKCMRIDSVAMLMQLYEKTERPEKAAKYTEIVGGILGVLGYPDGGTSFDSPIEVLFIQEEYLVTNRMPVKRRGTTIHDGHWFDVFDVEADGNGPARKVHFNIDLPHGALPKGLALPE